MAKEHRSEHISFFLNGLLHTVLVYLCLLLIFIFFRIFIWIYFDASSIHGMWMDVLKAFFYGFLFDTRTALVGLTPVILYNTIGQFSGSSSPSFYRTYNKVCRFYYTLIIVLTLFISIVDFRYLDYYKTHINVFVFGIFEDDTKAVLKTVWDENPVILAFLLVGVVAWIIYRLTGYARKKIHAKVISVAASGKVGIMALCWTLIFTGIRGSLGFFPLTTSSSVVSVNSDINNLVLNGMYALCNAFKDRTEQKIHVDIHKSLHANGFSSPQEAISIYIGKPVTDDLDSLIIALYDHTPVDTFLQNNPPNVIFIMMESMSEYFLSLHDRESLNLLGSLEDVMPECIRYTHFLPSVSSTIYSLECLLVKNVVSPLSHSIYVNESMETSSVIPFKDKGYEATFITGSKLGWRNMDKFIPRQYFDRVEGHANLEFHIENTTSSDWGAYDEFLFERIYQILNDHKTQPQFVFGLTTSNHPPYTYPSTYSPLPVNVPKYLPYNHTSGPGFTKKHLLTYQYANNCLGDFIKRLKSSPLGDNTIVAVTGDHNARAVFDYSDMHPIDKYAVPFILYIPDKYKEKINVYDTSCFASHKDIFPTIYHLALSGASYVKSGVNLLDKQQTDANFGITENNVILSRNGCVRFEMKPVYYVWTDSTRMALKPAGKEDIPALKEDLLYGKSYLASMTFLIQRSLLDK